MRTLRTSRPVVLLATVALAVAGCGGSSKPSAGTSAGTGTSATAGLTPSTPLSSAAAEAFLAHRISIGAPTLSSSVLHKAVQCWVQKLKSQGITTFQDLHANLNANVAAEGKQCIRSAAGASY